MPSFSSSSSIRAASEHSLLNLKFSHKLYHNSHSAVVHKLKGRLPKQFDVLLLSDLIFTISGSLDGQIVPSDQILRSALVNKLRSDLNAACISRRLLSILLILKQNALELGINNISDPYIDEDDDLVKMTLTPSRSLSRSSRPHAILVAVDLRYIWKTTGNIKNFQDSIKLLSDANPFAEHLYLPFEPLIKRVTEHFLTNQLVGRYPLIFGTWCRRLDMEAEYFPSVAQSILDIIHRSPNPHFVTRCKRLIKTARARHQSVLQTSAVALSSCFVHSDTEDPEEIDDANASTLTQDGVLCETLEQLFRAGVPHNRFKVIAAHSTLFSSSTGDDDQLVEPSQDDIILNHSDFPLIWHNHPDIYMDPSPEIVDMQQTMPDDMDSDPDDWPEEASPEYTFPDMPSVWTSHLDHSLINGLGPGLSGTAPRVTGFSPTGSEGDDSFALELGPDHEQENASVDMEDAEFERAVFHPPLSCHQSPQCRNNGFLTFLGCQEESEAGELEDFDPLVDNAFEDEDWGCEDEMLFDLTDSSAGLGVDAGPLCVSQVPK